MLSATPVEIEMAIIFRPCKLSDSLKQCSYMTVFQRRLNAYLTCTQTEEHLSALDLIHGNMKEHKHG